MTEVGEVELAVPRDRAGTFEPVTVPKHQRRLEGLSGNVNARFRRAIRHRGHLSNDQPAMKVLYLVARAKRQNHENMTGRINGRKTTLNTLTVHYGDRIADHIR